MVSDLRSDRNIFYILGKVPKKTEGGYPLEVGAEGETSGSFTGALTKPSLLYKDIGFEAGN